MQILIFAVILVVIVAFVIYTVNNKFGTKEIVILISLIIVGVAIVVFLFQQNENKVPKLFKEKYQSSYNTEILKLSATRLNDRYLSSEKNFVYNFDYIIKKNDKEFLCTSKNVKVIKIEDEYIFENFDKLNEECISK